MRTIPIRIRLALITLAAGAASACSAPNPMKLESDLRLEGPVTIQMELKGPTFEYEGTYISEELFKAVEPGSTSGAWALAAFGEPDRRSPSPDGGELWVWAYRAAGIQGSPIKVTSLGEDENATPPSMTVVLEVVDGRVTRKWRG